jgi:putative ATP-dependent endonuclease of OLD family
MRAVLVDLSDEIRRRFGGHCRRWDDTQCSFVDDNTRGADRADGADVVWALPLLLRARYDKEEDDFEAETFFDHPTPLADELDDEQAASLGEGRNVFTRAHKRLCGFLFLRTLRTGSRALGLQRGSLLDTILGLGGEGVAEMWSDTLARLAELDPAIGEIESLSAVLTGIRQRMGEFVNLAPGDKATAFFASDLTREHLRDVVRLFVATSPSDHPVPFARQGTGSINLLVFALLTMIADLKEGHSVIFAMEEPEIALPPHIQRRVTRYVLQEMGQAIVTSHSPYVIEQFDPGEIVMLDHVSPGELVSVPIDPAGIKPKSYRTQRRQFAEAILSRAVLVVEGGTEASLVPIVSSILERHHPNYTHIDLAGVSVFTADGDGDVPHYGPIFRSLGKLPFAMFDRQDTARTQDQQIALGFYDTVWESPELGVERLLVQQVPAIVQRRFLESVSQRSDFPQDCGFYDAHFDDDGVAEMTLAVLKARKGDAWGYAALLIAECQAEDDLPAFVSNALLEIDAKLKALSDVANAVPAAEAGGAAAPSGEAPSPTEDDPDDATSEEA